MSIYKNGKLIAGGRQCMPLLSFMWADHQLNDISWLRADTFSWQSGTVYTAVYQHLVDDIDGITAESETVGGITISFYRAPDGHKITTDESAVLSIYNATGVAWYYVLDTVNTRFKLPRTKFGFTGLRTGVGGYVEPELPNITGSVNLTGSGVTTTPLFNANDVADSALYNNVSITAGRYRNDNNTGSGYNRIEIDASRSSSIYKDGATVQPPATEMYLYFYVGQFTQTAIEQTAGLNAELFNGKAGVDLDNVSANGKATAVGWGLPDYTAGVSISSGYVATQKCWLHAYTSGDGANNQSGEGIVYVNNVRVVGARVTSWSYQTTNEIMVPLDVGDVVTSYTLRGTANMKIFPMKGL